VRVVHRPGGSEGAVTSHGGEHDLARSPAEVAAAARLAAKPGTANRLASLAARLLDAPSAQISILTDVQHVAAGAGAAAGAVGTQGPLEESLCTVTVRQRQPLLVDDAPRDERVAHLPPVTSGVVGSYLGVPLVTPDGTYVGALCVFDPEPREWTPEQVATLQDLVAPVIAELELLALSGEYASTQARWEVAMDAAGVGGFDWDLTTGRLSWDERLLEMFGYGEESFSGTIEGFEARVHIDDLPRVRDALQHAIDNCTTYIAEYRIVLPGGETRWVHARGRAMCDATGSVNRLLGAAYDTTAAHEGDARVARILESMSAAFFSLDNEWRFTYVNAEAERLLGRPREQLIGGEIWELFPSAVGSDFERQYRGAAASGQPTSFEAYYPAPLDSWYNVRAWPGPDGLSVYFLDISEQREMQERTAMVTSITSALAETLDANEIGHLLAQLAVGRLCDWSIVTSVDGEHPDWRRNLVDVASAHREDNAAALVEKYAASRLANLPETSPIAEVLQHRRRRTIIDPVRLAALETDPEAASLLEQLHPSAVMFEPLRARGRTLGVLTLGWSADLTRVQVAERVLNEVSPRAGLALDNARLYDEQRDLAESLQRSLLTAPPQPDHMQIAVRYEPASQVAQVGGDWYDAFLQPEGAAVLVIGDVVGHDTDSAAAMGQVRTLLRGIASATGAGPSDVLSQLDRTMELLQLHTTATALVARFEQTDEERAEGVTRMRWSNAGHPPPVAIYDDGTVVVLSDLVGFEPDLLLGFDPATERLEAQVVLPRATTVLLYTDGLVERRGRSLDEGLSALRDTLVEIGRRPLEELCDEVLRRLVPDRREDDIAIAAVRLHPQDRPRPAEAGPNDVPASIPDE